MSGLLINKVERLLAAGDIIEFPGVTAKVLSVSDDRATKVRLTLTPLQE
jgi:CBS domain containing-hemolysin-like protein